MARITLIFGVLLILLGVGFFFGVTVEEGEGRPITALIPAFFGLPVAILGFVGGSGGEKKRMHTAHAAVMITLLGVLGGFGMGIPGAIKKGLGPAQIEQIIMGVICLVHVALSVKSFISAKKAREAATAEEAA